MKAQKDKKPFVILFSGQAQHGKDESANICKAYFEMRNEKCMIIRYGDYLKFVAEKYHGWNGVKDNAGRQLLQILGTEQARDFNPDVWVNVVLENIKAFGHGFDYVLIPDFRYPNEHTRIVEEGYRTKTFFIFREYFDNSLTPEQKNHRSETSLLDYPFDHIISVPKESLNELRDKIGAVLRQMNNV